jgi:tRNA (guanine37-N1)-methyltransferase
MMRIDVITLFPGMFAGPLDESILKRARERELLQLHVHNLREFGLGRHRVVDDYPYGGGAGMVLRPEPFFAAVESVLAQARKDETVSGKEPYIILLTPQGRLFHQALARELAERPWLVLLCGRYEGVDERVAEHLAHDEISIGDYVLSGGELPAMVLIDAVTRLIPGALGAAEGTLEESFAQGLLEYPQYTRPAVFRGWAVPEVLLSGHHGEVARWRRRQAILRTWQRRPDLLAKASLTPEERAWLESVIASSSETAAAKWR